jgi:hypothetical protein
MYFHHFVSKRLVLPGLILAFEIVVECLSADFQRLAVKSDLSRDPAVIGLQGNKFQPFFFPDF